MQMCEEPIKKMTEQNRCLSSEELSEGKVVRLTIHSYNLCLYLLALPVDFHHAPFFVFEAFTQNQP